MTLSILDSLLRDPASPPNTPCFASGSSLLIATSMYNWHLSSHSWAIESQPLNTACGWFDLIWFKFCQLPMTTHSSVTSCQLASISLYLQKEDLWAVSKVAYLGWESWFFLNLTLISGCQVQFHLVTFSTAVLVSVSWCLTNAKLSSLLHTYYPLSSAFFTIFYTHLIKALNHPGGSHFSILYTLATTDHAFAGKLGILQVRYLAQPQKSMLRSLHGSC